MKKNLLLLLIGTTVLTAGCENVKNESKEENNSGTLTCTKESKNKDGYDEKDTMIVTYSNNKVTQVDETNIQEMDPTVVDFTVSLGQAFATSLSTLDGFNINYSKESDNSVKYTISVDYSKLDSEKLKEAYGDSFDENSFYANSNITISDFKDKNLSDYTCE